MFRVRSCCCCGGDGLGRLCGRGFGRSSGGGGWAQATTRQAVWYVGLGRALLGLGAARLPCNSDSATRAHFAGISALAQRIRTVSNLGRCGHSGGGHLSFDIGHIGREALDGQHRGGVRFEEGPHLRAVTGSGFGLHTMRVLHVRTRERVRPSINLDLGGCPMQRTTSPHATLRACFDPSLGSDARWSDVLRLLVS